MHAPVYNELTPVRRRQRLALVLRGAAIGLLAGSLAGVGLGLTRWLAGVGIEWSVGIALLATGPLLGALAGLMWPRTWRFAATAVDQHYQLKDRSVTALTFLAKPARTVFQDLEVQDTVQHLSKVEPRQVVPLRLPRILPYAVGAFVVALALMLWPSPSTMLEASPAEPLDHVLAVAERIEEDLKDFEELARQDSNEELKQLVEKMRELVEAMKQPGVDEREALAKLSEMQAAIQAQQAQYNVGLVEGQLQALGEAMTSANATEGAGKALQEGKHEKAAQELEKLEEPEFERNEARTAEEKLKQVAKSMGDAGLGQISEATSEMAEAVKGGGKGGKFRKASRDMAKFVRKHNRRKRISELLTSELAELEGDKCDCNSTAKGKAPKSKRPSSNWGMGTAGNIQGEKTNILAERKLEQVQGIEGEGPGEVETTHSAEGRQQAARKYRDMYQKYRKMSESVLDSEPIPLGHRQTIRRYFELIRPQNDGESKDSPGGK